MMDARQVCIRFVRKRIANAAAARYWQPPGWRATAAYELSCAAAARATIACLSSPGEFEALAAALHRRPWPFAVYPRGHGAQR